MKRVFLVSYAFNGKHGQTGFGNVDLTVTGPWDFAMVKEAESQIKEKGGYERVIILAASPLESSP